ncbi:ParB/RepB/Spo0J family partition protein [Ruegeria sp. HKCCD8929]|uniref:ParB/RepB/Spo0J family partition protein n=1 Tax=Ruegeria sp. HKCCD8929 TaxID=2683006 RepID=UPI001487C8FC|nr:ParB/RepB/Spo0J family partition protein [Ruegeria sp. HKCCD8929]
MTEQSKITATEARIPLGRLTLSPMNPRQDVPEADVVELADSIWAAGLIQSIAGLADDKGGAEIVAGGRRLRALHYLAEQHPTLAKTHPGLANPMVMLAPDAETAETWANAENISRKDLAPADEIRAYGKMHNAGAPVPGIARAFAVTEKHVYRRLALANLHGQIIDALAAGEISLSMAACFTISNDEKLSLEVLERVRGDHWSDHQLKSMLKPDSVTGSDRRAVFVGEEAYKDAGGRLGGDLFAEQTFFDDVALLDDLFATKLAESGEAVTGTGWKWVEVLDASYVGYYEIEQRKLDRIYREEGVLSEADAARYDELAELAEGDALDAAGEAELAALQETLDGVFTDAQKAHAGVLIHVNQSGGFQTIEGLVRREDKKAAIEAGVLQRSSHISGGNDKRKSPISQKLADDLARVVTGARQHAALRDPDLIMALLAFQLAGGVTYGKPIGLSQNEVPNWPTTEAVGYALDERLTTLAEWSGDEWDRDVAKEFRSFRKKGADHIQAELIRHLASLLSGGEKDLCALIDREVKPDVREVWTPTDENFFSRVGGPYLNAIWREVLGFKADHPTITTFEKLKKRDKVAKLHSLFNDPGTREVMKLSKAAQKRIAKWLTHPNLTRLQSRREAGPTSGEKNGSIHSEPQQPRILEHRQAQDRSA